MNDRSQKPDTIGVSGDAIHLRVSVPESSLSAVSKTAFTALTPFENVTTYLSDKPLRRPNRIRPLG